MMGGVKHLLRMADRRLEGLLADPVAGSAVMGFLLNPPTLPLRKAEFRCQDGEGRRLRLRISSIDDIGDMSPPLSGTLPPVTD
jgi:hypothetical protein